MPFISSFIQPSDRTEAAWYPADGLPRIPEKISMARRLIDWFAENHKQGEYNHDN
ncbi:MAG: hypothetical protein JW913_05055 [Chitinispirillaceae bacterium]|nr:hypothetical protein [Chitinispirillaceae bacterium]